MDYTHSTDSPLGGLLLASDGEALTGLWFEEQKHFAEGLDPLHREEGLPVFDLAERWLEAYFAGRDPGFTPPLHMRGTAFRRAVWAILLTIPRGQTLTYGEIAARLEQAQGGAVRVSPRAVGGAVGHNPVSLIVPCHRVVGAGGRLTGYAGGTDKKLRLLTLEGAEPRRYPLLPG